MLVSFQISCSVSFLFSSLSAGCKLYLEWLLNREKTYAHSLFLFMLHACSVNAGFKIIVTIVASSTLLGQIYAQICLVL